MNTQLHDFSGVAFDDGLQSSRSFKTSVPAFNANSLEPKRETAAVKVANRIIEGRIFPSDRAYISDILREAFQRNSYRQLQQDINELLSSRTSPYRLLLDDSMCNAEATKLLLLYVIDKQRGQITSGMSTIISVDRAQKMARQYNGIVMAAPPIAAPVAF